MGAYPIGVAVGGNAVEATVTADPDPAPYGRSVTFTARVTCGVPPTGSVEFFDGTTGLGTAALTGGTATLRRSDLAAGEHRITARYRGDARCAATTSPPIRLTVTGSARPPAAAPGTAVPTPPRRTATVTGGPHHTPTATGTTRSCRGRHAPACAAGTAHSRIHVSVDGGVRHRHRHP